MALMLEKEGQCSKHCEKVADQKRTITSFPFLARQQPPNMYRCSPCASRVHPLRL